MDAHMFSQPIVSELTVEKLAVALPAQTAEPGMTQRIIIKQPMQVRAPNPACGGQRAIGVPIKRMTYLAKRGSR